MPTLVEQISAKYYATYVLRRLLVETHITVKWGYILLGCVTCHDETLRLAMCAQDKRHTAGVRWDRAKIEYTHDDMLGTCNSMEIRSALP